MESDPAKVGTNPGKGIVLFQLNQTPEWVLLRCGAINNCGMSVIELTSEHDGQKAAAEKPAAWEDAAGFPEACWKPAASSQKPAAGANLQTGMQQHTAEIVVPKTSLAGASPPASKKARIEEGSETGKRGVGSRSGGAPWQSEVDDEVAKMKAKHAHELNMMKLRQEKEMQDLKGQKRTQTELASDTKACPLQTLEGIIEEKRKQIERNSNDKSLPLASCMTKRRYRFLNLSLICLKTFRGDWRFSRSEVEVRGLTVRNEQVSLLLFK
jgi:hypothetical protein